jgi:polyphosphate kinase 2 (PPK2 family)
VIKRITQRLSPRVVRTVALPAPNDRERTQWCFQRYATHLPACGEIALFDRSWYNRAKKHGPWPMTASDRGRCEPPMASLLLWH